MQPAVQFGLTNTVCCTVYIILSLVWNKMALPHYFFQLWSTVASNKFVFLFHTLDLCLWHINSINAGTYENKLFYFHIVDLCIIGSGSSVGIATAYGLDGPGIESWWGRDFPHLSRPALGPTQPPVQWVPVLSGGKVRLGRDDDPSPLLVLGSKIE